MGQTGGAVRLLDQFGNPVDVQDGVAVPTSTSSLLSAGVDSAGAARNLAILAKNGRNRLLVYDEFQRREAENLQEAVAALGEGQQAILDRLNATLNVSVTSSPTTSIPRPGQLILGHVTSGAGVTAIVRATAYNEPLTNAQRSVSSSNASDAAAGTGARTVRITYYDQALNGPFVETITLNGTTAVNTVSNTICVVDKIEVIKVGSFGANIGVITLFLSTAGGGGALGSIAVGDSQTFWAHHNVGAGTTMNLEDVSVSSTGGALFFWRFEPSPDDNTLAVYHNDEFRVLVGQPSYLRRYRTPIPLVGPGEFHIGVLADANSTTSYASANYYEVPPGGV